eukprot:6201974-Pleurochrysis_carterae.AAC.2
MDLDASEIRLRQPIVVRHSVTALTRPTLQVSTASRHRCARRAAKHQILNPGQACTLVGSPPMPIAQLLNLFCCCYHILAASAALSLLPKLSSIVVILGALAVTQLSPNKPTTRLRSNFDRERLDGIAASDCAEQRIPEATPLSAWCGGPGSKWCRATASISVGEIEGACLPLRRWRLFAVAAMAARATIGRLYWRRR